MASLLGAVASVGPIGAPAAAADHEAHAVLRGVATGADGVEPLRGARFLLSCEDVEESRLVQCDGGSGRFEVVVKHGLYRVSELSSPVAGVSFPLVRAILVTGDRAIRLPFRAAREVRVVPRTVADGERARGDQARLLVGDVLQGDRLDLGAASDVQDARAVTPSSDGSFGALVGDDPVQCALRLLGHWAPPIVLSPESPPTVGIDAYRTRAVCVTLASDVDAESASVEFRHAPTGASGSFWIQAGAAPVRLTDVPVGELTWRAWFSSPAAPARDWEEEGSFVLVDGPDAAEWRMDTRRSSFPARASGSVVVAPGWDHRDARVVAHGAPPVPVRLKSANDGSSTGSFVVPLRRPSAAVPIVVSPFGWATVLRVAPDGAAGPIRVPPPRSVSVRFVAEETADVGEIEVAWTSGDSSDPGGRRGQRAELLRASPSAALALRVPVGVLRLAASADLVCAPDVGIRIPESGVGSEATVDLMPRGRLRVTGDLRGAPIPIGGWTLRVGHGNRVGVTTVHPSAVACTITDVEPGPVELEGFPPAGFGVLRWRGVARAGAATTCVLTLR